MQIIETPSTLGGNYGGFYLIRKQSIYSFFQEFVFVFQYSSLREHPELDNSSVLCFWIIWEHPAGYYNFYYLKWFNGHPQIVQPVT